MTPRRRFRHALATGVGLVALIALAVASGPAAAADTKPPAKKKLKKNEAVISPEWAARGVKSVALAPIRVTEGDEKAAALTRAAIENALHDRGFKVFPAGSVLSTVDRDGAKEAFAAASKAFDADAPLDSASAAALGKSLNTDALLFVSLNQWTRYIVDEYTRGASFTQVGIEGGAYSLVDGTVLWRGSFLEKMDGPYNEPERGDLDARDPGRNSQKKAELEPPLFEEVLDKLMLRTAGTMPKPPAPAPAAASAPAPASK